MWYVYMLRCGDASLYAGITTDVERRVEEHKKGKGGSFTRSHLPVELVYREKCEDRSSALKREIEIKSMAKTDKEKIVLKTGS